MSAAYPLPWCVGPFGEIWVASDVELVEGKWRETCPEPRLVISMSGRDSSLAEFIVRIANATLVLPPPY